VWKKIIFLSPDNSELLNVILRIVHVLGRLVDSVLAIRPKFRGTNVFLTAIIVRSMIFFGGEVMPSAPCRKILQHVKDTQEI
jgi:hypothetical protein